MSAAKRLGIATYGYRGCNRNRRVAIATEGYICLAGIQSAISTAIRSRQWLKRIGRMM